MAEFTITAVKPEPRVWEGEHGKFHIYDVEFQGDTASGKGQIKQKATTAPPTVGMKNDYDLVRKGDFPPELKRIQQQGGGGGRPEDPKREARIVRQHSQHMAMLHVASMERRGSLPDNWDLPALRKVIDWYQADAMSGGEQA